MPGKCNGAPEGWQCQLAPGHTCPCACAPMEFRAPLYARLWCVLSGGHKYKTRIDTARYAFHSKCARCKDTRVQLIF